MNMIKNNLLKKILQLMSVMILASFITFSLTYISPSDPAEMLLTAHDIVPTQELLEKTREEMGLNDPFIMQYGNWLKGLFRGDFGYSYSTRGLVADILPQRIFMTVRLAVAALLFLIFFSFVLGILSAVKKNTVLDYIVRGLSLMGISIPAFWLGLMLMYVFVVELRWFKITEQTSFKSVILPAMTLAIPLMGRYIRQIREAILEQYSQDYVIGARARGIKESKIIIKHILPNALLGIITLLGLSIALLLGGTVIVENIFSWPGLGSMALEAITYRDYPLLQSYVVFMTLIYVTINFIVDIITQTLDPRISLKGGGKVSEK
ncbi:ABC-type dipeptide/oligopeptide/nickel transport system, permease component [Clostridium aceticum]|uniref:Nickel import system permease protein NikB n=2 Tax=Clostridium aceticum TaxID=84022 RepID=A0A0G3WDA8_9CLOT|nr:ABC-type dipeptide/oligopeptide/nickel transport system, permease component [Clostridium aceticum]